MFGSTALAQTTSAAKGAGGPQDFLANLGGLPILVMMFALLYFLVLRPQQRRMKQHQQMIAALKRGDTVVLSSGVVGKVTRVEDTEVAVDIAQGVNVKVVKSMITEVRVKGEPVPANDAKS